MDHISQRQQSNREDHLTLQTDESHQDFFHILLCKTFCLNTHEKQCVMSYANLPLKESFNLWSPPAFGEFLDTLENSNFMGKNKKKKGGEVG